MLRRKMQACFFGIAVLNIVFLLFVKVELFCATVALIVISVTDRCVCALGQPAFSSAIFDVCTIQSSAFC